MKPSVGRIVILQLTEEQNKKLGGNHLSGTNEAPAIIVNVWGKEEGSAVNLKVLGDSPENIWITSVVEGTEPGQWRDPNPVKVKR